MSLDLVLTIALDLAFFAVLGLTFVEYLRHRERVRLVVVLVFASLAIVLAAAPIRALVPALGPLLSVVSLPAFLAHPLLVLWLASFLRPMPRPALVAATIAYVALSGVLVALVMSGGFGSTGGSPRNPALTPVLLGLLVYFLLLEAAAALSFGLAARDRAGASRARLAIAATATALFGAALVIVLAGSLVNAPGSDAAAVTNVAVRVIALFSAFGYLAAFAPPRALRRITQQAILYDFIRKLSALPTGSEVQRTWDLLTSTVRKASGASRVEVVERGAGPVGARPGIRTVAVPFTSLRWPEGRLELDISERALFLEDDLELTNLLVDRGVRAAEREAFMVERERLIAELQAASAAKSDFLAAMSHELRTPLNAIIGFSELLREGDDAADPETVVSYAEHIHGSGLHLLDLVNDVLDLARVEAGRLDLKRADLDLEALVRSTVAAVQPLATEKGQAITLALAPISIEADMQRIRQVILNLLSNAIKFTGTGGAIRLTLGPTADGSARLTVADNGRGIAAEDLERIFEAFQQAGGDGTTTHHEGTGLGLALTRQLVEAHGGTVSARSQVGQGSEFTVILPAKRVAPVESGPPVVASGGPRVLVIEDDPAAQELLRHRLEGAGYAVLVTASGRQGLDWMREIRPDAVLLDILLPDVDGWEVLQEAKSDPETRSIPIMVVSVVDNRQLGLALGAVDYFVKPVSRERLIEALGRLTFTTKVKSRTVTALVIDADPGAADRYRQMLEPDGFRVIEAATGGEGRRRAVEERPDLILLDALLPDVDAFELASTLRNDPATAAIPVWLSTPAGLQPDAKAKLNGNVQGVVARGDDALAAMRAWLEVPKAPSRPGEAGA